MELTILLFVYFSLRYHSSGWQLNRFVTKCLVHNQTSGHLVLYYGNCFPYAKLHILAWRPIKRYTLNYEMAIVWISLTILLRKCNFLNDFKWFHLKVIGICNFSYDIMLHCWNASPEKRPTFRSLEYKFGGMLESGVKDVS